MILNDQHPPKEKPTVSQTKSALRKDDSKLRSKAARPAAKDDGATMTDSSAALQKAKDSDKKAACTAGKSSGGSAGKSSAAR